jgi:hypothetical protein
VLKRTFWFRPYPAPFMFVKWIKFYEGLYSPGRYIVVFT